MGSVGLRLSAILWKPKGEHCGLKPPKTNTGTEGKRVGKDVTVNEDFEEDL